MAVQLGLDSETTDFRRILRDPKFDPWPLATATERTERLQITAGESPPLDDESPVSVQEAREAAKTLSKSVSSAFTIMTKSTPPSDEHNSSLLRALENVCNISLRVENETLQPNEEKFELIETSATEVLEKVYCILLFLIQQGQIKEPSTENSITESLSDLLNCVIKALSYSNIEAIVPAATSFIQETTQALSIALVDSSLFSSILTQIFTKSMAAISAFTNLFAESSNPEFLFSERERVVHLLEVIAVGILPFVRDGNQRKEMVDQLIVWLAREGTPEFVGEEIEMIASEMILGWTADDD